MMFTLGTRTHDLVEGMELVDGFEPPTRCLQGSRSGQLSYTSIKRLILLSPWHLTLTPYTARRKGDVLLKIGSWYRIRDSNP